MTITCQTYLPPSIEEFQKTLEYTHSVPSHDPQFGCVTNTFQTYLPLSIEQVQQTAWIRSYSLSLPIIQSGSVTVTFQIYLPLSTKDVQQTCQIWSCIPSLPVTLRPVV